MKPIRCFGPPPLVPTRQSQWDYRSLLFSANPPPFWLRLRSVFSSASIIRVPRNLSTQETTHVNPRYQAISFGDIPDRLPTDDWCRMKRVVVEWQPQIPDLRSTCLLVSVDCPLGWYGQASNRCRRKKSFFGRLLGGWAKSNRTASSQHSRRPHCRSSSCIALFVLFIGRSSTIQPFCLGTEGCCTWHLRCFRKKWNPNYLNIRRGHNSCAQTHANNHVRAVVYTADAD